MFELHPTLKHDTALICELKLCKLLLMNNSLYPWVILVPKVNNLIEIIDLPETKQLVLMKEIALVSRVMKQQFKADKLNVAALGNIVNQLHIHIIARYKNDSAFPNTVWSDTQKKSYDPIKLKEITVKISEAVKRAGTGSN